MELKKGALMHVVRAARIADRTAEDMKSLLVDRMCRTWVDEISGELNDALYEYAGEQLGCEQDFLRDSETMKLIRCAKSDAEVTDEFVRIAEENRNGETPQMITQPKPQMTSREEFRDMVRRYGGYLYEPKKREESKWKGTLKQLHSSRKENEKLRNLLLDAANELCANCKPSSYECCDCKWRKIKRGEIPNDAE